MASPQPITYRLRIKNVFNSWINNVFPKKRRHLFYKQWSQNGSADQLFPITFSKHENGIYCLEGGLSHLLWKNFSKIKYPLQSYRHFSKLLPSKPSQHSARTCAARYSRQRAKWPPFQNTTWLFWLLPNSFKYWENNYFANIFLQTRRLNKIMA